MGSARGAPVIVIGLTGQKKQRVGGVHLSWLFIDHRAVLRLRLLPLTFFVQISGLLMFNISSEDGYIRSTLAQLQIIHIRHLISGLDEDMPPEPGGVVSSSTVITGYTEYVHEGGAVITIGWDWELMNSSGPVQLRRVGNPRSNIMLVDEHLHDLGHATTERLLGEYVDTVQWQAPTLEAINARYRL